MTDIAYKKYRQSAKGKVTAKKYLKTEIGKAIHKRAMKKYLQSEKGKLAAKKYRQSEKGKTVYKKSKKKYSQTEKGKIYTRNRAKKARYRRKKERHMDWIPLFENPFDDSEIIDWHHITETLVVAIPKDLHQLYYGKYHREQIMTMVRQIYWGW